MPDLDFGGRMSVADSFYWADAELPSSIDAEESFEKPRTRHVRADNDILRYNLFLHQNIHRVYIRSTTAAQTLGGLA
jgi:hypothetical protein